MLTPQQLLRITIEIIFVLLGGLVVWLGLSGHILFDRRKPGWLLLSVAVILWGLRALYKPVQWPFLWVGRLLAFAGLLLVVRGLIGSVLIFRPR